MLSLSNAATRQPVTTPRTRNMSSPATLQHRNFLNDQYSLWLWHSFSRSTIRESVHTSQQYLRTSTFPYGMFVSTFFFVDSLGTDDHWMNGGYHWHHSFTGSKRRMFIVPICAFSRGWHRPFPSQCLLFDKMLLPSSLSY